jgi:hypothetical protein
LRICSGKESRRSRPATDCERACLRLADKFVLDPHGVDDADTAVVAAYLSPPAMVALLALFMGFSKIAVVLGTAPESMPVTILPTPA